MPKKKKEKKKIFIKERSVFKLWIDETEADIKKMLECDF